MKKLYFLLLVTIITFNFQVPTSNCNAQTVTIPDANFVSWLGVNGFASCLTGNKLDTSCAAVKNATIIDCSGASIGNLQGIQFFPKLSVLTCSHNPLTVIPALPPNLTQLYCLHDLISTLPALPKNLIILQTDDNTITSWPALNPNLVNFYCRNDHLTTLPTVLPATLELFLCDTNQLTSLPALPKKLNLLRCNYNNLTYLPALDSGLQSLECNNNKITSLPKLPALLGLLDCSYNMLTSLPSLPDDLNNLHCNNNPNLDCLPSFHYMNLMDISSTGIKCLPSNDGMNAVFPTAAKNYPYCNNTKANPCNSFWNVSGRVYLDDGANCTYAVGDPTLANVKVLLYENGSVINQSFTDKDGIYHFTLSIYDTYSIQVDTASLPYYVDCPVGFQQTYNYMYLDSVSPSEDFGVLCKKGFDVGTKGVVCNGQPYPNKKFDVNVLAGNMANFYGGNCSNLSGTIKLIFSGPISYTGYYAGSQQPTSTTGDSIVWKVANFSNFSFSKGAHPVFTTLSGAKAGDQVCFTVVVTPSSPGDYNTSNNTINFCSAVKSTKSVTYKEASPTSTTEPGGLIAYTIHFQNTDTATVKNLYITDAIDNNLDLSTLVVTAHSHNVFTEVLANRIVRFNFYNINLPDSSANADSSKGFVQYTIRTDTSIVPGTFIANFAKVYFDNKSAFNTNTTLNGFTLTGIAGAAQNKIFVYPNPTSGMLNIILSKECNGCMVNVLDMAGRVVAPPKSSPEGGLLEVDMSTLAAGIYFVRVSSDGEVQTVKVVKGN